MKLRWPSIILSTLLLAANIHAAKAPTPHADPLQPTGQWSAFSKGNAPTPPMGWNSWNAFRTDVDESKVVGAAKTIVDSGLARKGYRYINIDDGWWLKRRQSDGRIVIRTALFPSADRGENQNTSFRPFVDRVHAMGLKAGIYTDVGRNACSQVWDLHSPNLPEGSTAEREVGLWNHLPQDIALFFEEWGFDYVKVDACGIADYGSDKPFIAENDYQPLEPLIIRGDLPNTDVAGVQKLYGDLSKTLATVNEDNDYVLSICTWGTANVRAWGKNYGNLWRTSEDIRSSWDSMLHVFDSAVTRALFAGPGTWNDPDMLYIGHGDFDENHLVEAKTHFSLWAVLAAPLMIGFDLREAPSSLLDIWGAEEVIAINQDAGGHQGVLMQDNERSQVIVKSLSHPREKAVVLFNRSDAVVEVTLLASDLGMKENKPVQLRDLWQEKSAGQFVGKKTFTLPPHDSLTFKATGERALEKGRHLSEMPGRINVAVDGLQAVSLDPVAHRTLAQKHAEKHESARKGSGYRQSYPGFGGPRANVSPYGDAITLNGLRYRHGIGALANSRLEIKAQDEFTRFSAIVGVDEGSLGKDGKATFVVYGDGRELAATKPLGVSDKPVTLDVDVQGVDIVELVARQTRQDPLPMVVGWADAVLE